MALLIISNTGDDPPRDRTGELRVMGFPTRRLGPVQMTTDTALGVSKRIVADGGGHNLVVYRDARVSQLISQNLSNQSTMWCVVVSYARGYVNVNGLPLGLPQYKVQCAGEH